MTFESLLRSYRLYEALALYDAYYERAADLNDKYEHLGDALDIAWVPMVFHCTYFDNLEEILKDGKLRPGKGKGGSVKAYVSLTELGIIELTRFRSLRPKPFEVAIGFPRASLESRGLYQPAYLKHASDEVKQKFVGALDGYIELDDDLGAFHEVRIPDSLPIDDAVWVLSSKRNEQSGMFDIPELKSVQDAGIAISLWHPSHQIEMIREPVFRKEISDDRGNLESIKCCGRHYLPDTENYVEKVVTPPTGKPFSLRFPKELQTDNLKDRWEGPFSKYEMAVFFFGLMKNHFPVETSKVKLRIEM